MQPRHSQYRPWCRSLGSAETCAWLDKCGNAAGRPLTWHRRRSGQPDCTAATTSLQCRKPLAYPKSQGPGRHLPITARSDKHAAVASSSARRPISFPCRRGNRVTRDHPVVSGNLRRTPRSAPLRAAECGTVPHRQNRRQKNVGLRTVDLAHTAPRAQNQETATRQAPKRLPTRTALRIALVCCQVADAPSSKAAGSLAGARVSLRKCWAGDSMSRHMPDTVRLCETGACQRGNSMRPPGGTCG